MSARPSSRIETLERHQVRAPFAAQRLPAAAAVRALLVSMEQYGQRTPVVAVREADTWVLVDGYRRWEALDRLRADTVEVECWDCPLPEALARVVSRHQGRVLEPIEQAWLLQEALTHGSSQRQLAAWLGRDPSWVNRRLGLLNGLTEPVLEAVRTGVISAWAASRVLVPLARANTAAAQALVDGLREQPLATRDLQAWYRHYQQGSPTLRARLLAHPALFRDALQSERSTATPEALWLQRSRRVRAELQRLHAPLTELLTPLPPIEVGQRLHKAVFQIQDAAGALAQLLEVTCHAIRSGTRDDPAVASEGHGGPADQPDPGPCACHDPPGAERTCATGGAEPAAGGAGGAVR